MRKLIIQSVICIILAVFFEFSNNGLLPEIKQVSDRITNVMYDNPDKNDIRTFLNNTYTKATSASETLSTFHEKVMNGSEYGDPIDKEFEGQKTAVYSVNGGTVREIGINENYGRYVIVQHGYEAESIYGNLSDVCCTLNQNIKKGAIVGEYTEDDEKKFYYKLNYFD